MKGRRGIIRGGDDGDRSPPVGAQGRSDGASVRGRRPVARLGGWLLFAVLLAVPLPQPGSALADEPGPRPPCDGGPPVPPYPEAPDAAPNIAFWHGDRLAAVARRLSASCAAAVTGTGRPTLILALAGAFRHRGGADPLLARFGRVSALRTVRYWSVAGGRWLPMVDDAAALSRADPGERRPDFTVAEMKSGGDLYFAQRDNRSSGEVVYRLRVLESGPERVTLTIENASPVRFLLLTLFAPGDLRSTYVLQPIAQGVWGYYALVAVRAGPMAQGHEASYANRAVAVYRHVAGVPTDGAPPVRSP